MLAGVVAWRWRAPLEVWAEADPGTVWSLALDGEHLPPYPQRERGPAATLPGLRDWLVTLNAVDHEVTTCRLFVKNRTSDVLLLRDVQCQVISRRPGIRQTLVTSPPAGAVAASALTFDLDQDPPQALGTIQDGLVVAPGDHPVFAGSYIEIQPQETHEFRVRATTTQDRLVDWRLGVDYQHGPRRRGEVPAVPQPAGWFRTCGGRRGTFEHRWMCGAAALPDQVLRRADPAFGE